MPSVIRGFLTKKAVPFSELFLNFLIHIQYNIYFLVFQQKNTCQMVGIFYTNYPNKWKFTTSVANTIEIVDKSFIKMLIAGPEVSLNGSPTVSPTTAAL